MARELDARRLPNLMGSMTGLWFILVLSTWIGVIIGAAIIAAAGFATALVLTVVTFGLGGLAVLEAVSAVIAFGGVIVFFGFVAVPAAASLAAYLKLRFANHFIIGEWALKGLPPDDPLVAVVNNQAARLGLARAPETMKITNVANALAIRASRNVSIVAIGTPLVLNLEHDETSAILGHELGHIVCGDAQRTVFAMEFQKFLTGYLLFHGIQKFARWVLTPVGEILLLSLSRRREYWADAIGAALTSKDSMISALEKIHDLPVRHIRKEKVQSELMFLGIGRWFSTHPTLEQRVRALETGKYLSRLPYRDVLEIDPAEHTRRASVSLTSGI